MGVTMLGSHFAESRGDVIHAGAAHGLEWLAKALFEEVRESSVGVIPIHPGFVHSQLTAAERLDSARLIRVSDIAEMTAMGVELTVRPQRSLYRHSDDN
ncbi:hypothetical protein [Halomonas nitroreducens]|uniref:SDR family NAD(P)-dependent oxidoreductase n=1 Tax=Halomonas nitroreducens TaxID=447425 RepID=A0A3S0HQT9_9GAMM|nr:hypothetical protein [Halomonas nitroreducens]RTR00456.1 hypothetical protein EKG36_15725 [Halomonas nitroreducens]